MECRIQNVEGALLLRFEFYVLAPSNFPDLSWFPIHQFAMDRTTQDFTEISQIFIRI